MPTNFLQNGASWLGLQLQAHAGRTVRLEVGRDAVAEITATLVQANYEVDDQRGFRTEAQSYDWTFTASDIGFHGITLRKGAIVVEVDGDGVEHKYEAMPFGQRHAVEPLDSSGILLTLHTKKVSPVNA